MVELFVKVKPCCLISLEPPRLAALPISKV